MPETKSKIQEFQIKGMDCANCALKVETQISKLYDVSQVKVDFLTGKMKLEFRDKPVNLEEVNRAVKSAGYVLDETAKRQTSNLIVEGMDCADEAGPIERHLEKIPGIYRIRFNLVARKLILEHDNPISEIRRELKSIGFQSRLDTVKKDTGEGSFLSKHRELIFTLGSGLFALTGLILRMFFSLYQISIVFFLAAILAGGYRFMWKGLKEGKRLSLGMDFLMTIAVVGAVFLGEWTEAAMVVFLFCLAQLLESYSMEKARRSIETLMDIAPDIAIRKTEQGEENVPVEEIAVGEIIVVKPGSRIPLDGRVTDGTSRVNQAPITGESIPQKKKAGDPVFAGTINQQGALEIMVESNAENSTLAKIIRLVEEAQSQKAPTQLFVEKFARYYTPSVVFAAVLFAAIPPLFFGAEFQEWFYRALVLLVISCPCALVISTPVTIVSALTNSARNGILVKGGVYLENFDRIRALAFDKTGTITVGAPSVEKVISLNYLKPENLIKIAASIESRSEHHLGKAIVEYAGEQNIERVPVSEFESITGKGVRGKIDGQEYFIGNHRLFEENGWCHDAYHQNLRDIEDRNHTAVILGNENGIVGIFAIADKVRENVSQTFGELQKSGIRELVLLTGDNRATAAAIAKDVGLENYHAELLPADKLRIIYQLTEKFGVSGMVGDGINDAPALAAASIGISMGASGTDTALETADIALMEDDLGKLVYLKKLSRKTRRIIKENISISLFLKGLFFFLAVPGWATLWMAVFADMGASLIVIFNSLRALRLSGADGK